MLNQQLILGSIYRVKFKGVFERHGVCSTPGLTCLHQGNGVFKLEAITTYRTLVHSGVKLYDTFFQPLGISRADYEQYYSDKPADKYSPVFGVQTVDDIKTQTEWARDAQGNIHPIKKTVKTTIEKFTETGESRLAKFAKDSVDFAHTPIYKFVDVIDPDDIVYAPALTIDSFPEIELSLYQDLSLVFRLGYFDDPTKLDPMLLAIRERLAAYGIRPKLIKLYSTGSKYMNPDEYEAIKSVRLPAEIVTIDQDAKYSDYAGRKVITTNSVKAIVDSNETDATQVPFESLKAQPMVMDRRLFSKVVTPNDCFNGNSNYYEGIVRHATTTDTEYVNGKVYFIKTASDPDEFTRWYGASYEDVNSSPRKACLRSDVRGLYTIGGNIPPYVEVEAGSSYVASNSYFVKLAEGYRAAVLVSSSNIANGSYVVPDKTTVDSLYIENSGAYALASGLAKDGIQYYRMDYVPVDAALITELSGTHVVVRADHYIKDTNDNYVHPQPPAEAIAIPGTAYYSYSDATGSYTLLKPGTPEQVQNHQANYVEGQTDMSDFYVVDGYNYVHPVPQCLYDTSKTYYQRTFTEVGVADGITDSAGGVVGLYISQTPGTEWSVIDGNTPVAAVDGVTYYAISGDTTSVVKIVDFISTNQDGSSATIPADPQLYEAEYAWHKLDNCPVGGKVLIMEWRQYTAADAQCGKAAYAMSDDTYVQVGYNEPRSVHLYMKEVTETERELISVDTYLRYRHPSASELIDGSLVLYRKIPGKYTRVNPKINGYYWISKPLLTGIGNGNVIYDDMTSEKALQCLGYTFRFGTSTSKQKTMTAMGLDDILTLTDSTEVDGIEMYVDPGSPANSSVVEDNKVRFQMYAGRLFRTNMQFDVKSGDNVITQTVQVELTVPSVPDPSWVGLTGDILGQRGVISREVYLVDENAINRNYYIQYLQQKDRADRLEDRNKKLEEVITQLHDALTNSSN